MGQGQFQSDEEYSTSKGEFKDLKSIKLGTGKDFRIWYTGGNARLVCADGDIQFNHATNYDLAESNETFANQESMLHLEDDAGVKAYYDGVKKFETLSDGAKIHGKLEVDGDLKLEDDDKFICGDDDDLQIYHDTTGDDFSTIKNTTSTQLFIANNNKDIFLRADDGKDGIRLHPSGENYKVELFFNDDVKLTTTTSGVEINGDLTTTTQDGGDIRPSGNVKVLNDKKLICGADDDIQIYHDTTGDDFSTIKNTTETEFFITNGGESVFIRSAPGKNGIRLYADNDGADYEVVLYHGGDTEAFRTTSDGAKVTGDLEVTGDLDVDDIRLTDTGVLSLGTGADMTIFHDGSNAHIKNLGTGNLFIAGHDDCHIYIRAKTGENSIVCYDDAGVELYEDNELRFETVEGGCKVTGDLEVTDDIDLSDNGMITLGTGDDMEVYHDGSNGYVRIRGTGNLFIVGSDSEDPGDGDTHIHIRAKSGDDSIVCYDDGGVTIHYDDEKKFETTDTGATVTGNLTVTTDVFCSDLDISDSGKIKLGSGDDLTIYHDGSNGYIKNLGTGNLFIAGHDACHIHIRAKTGENSIICYDDGSVALYEDNELRFETVDGGCKVTGDLEVTGDLDVDDIRLTDTGVISLGTGADMTIYHDGDNAYIKNLGTGNIFIAGHDDCHIHIRAKQGEDSVVCYDDGATKLFDDGSEKLTTASYGVRIFGELRMDDNEEIRLGDDEDLEIYWDGSNARFDAASHFKFNKDLWPSDTSLGLDIGTPSFHWDNLYYDELKEQSDRRVKTDIVDSDLGLSFINKLSPKSYRKIRKTEIGYGFIAQEVEEVLVSLNKPTDDYAIVMNSDETEHGYFLNYHQFIAPLTKAVQELSAEVETLKAEVAALKSS